MKELLAKLLPFELKRGTSLLSIVLALIVAGVLGKIGELLAGLIIEFLAQIIPVFRAKVLPLLFLTIQVNVLSLLLVSVIFILVLFPIYRYLDRFFLKRKEGELIFTEEFEHGFGWHLNYWGTVDPDKTNRIQNSQMVFEAVQGELLNQDGYGAFFDLQNGIYYSIIYRVIARVRSIGSTTMTFRLWVHDAFGNANVYSSEQPIIPTEKGQEVSVEFKATMTNALRIHLHCKGGSGQIIVEYVRVYKI